MTTPLVRSRKAAQQQREYGGSACRPPGCGGFRHLQDDKPQITNFNISVGITDAFMRAVKNDEEWELRFPDMKEMKHHGFSGTLEQAEAAGIKINTYKKINARELFNKIVTQAHHNGEPGVLFLDAANRGNPVPHLYTTRSHKPMRSAMARTVRELLSWFCQSWLTSIAT